MISAFYLYSNVRTVNANYKYHEIFSLKASHHINTIKYLYYWAFSYKLFQAHQSISIIIGRLFLLYHHYHIAQNFDKENFDE